MTYNALDNQQAAARLYWQLVLEILDLEAALEYNEATDREWIPDAPEYDHLAEVTELARRLKVYAGDDAIESAKAGNDG